jgi:penicillin G amidase
VSPPRPPWRRRLLRLAVVLLALPVIAGAAGAGLYWRWSRAALPAGDGERRVAGLGAPVTVRRDAQGVPHVEAASLADAFRAQGYVLAQDRLWQMDLLRRRARGELAEAFGEAGLRPDREVRTLGLGRVAAASVETLPAETRALVEAYTQGVNAFIAEGSRPLEFRLLNYAPRPWTPADSLAVGKLLAYDLARGWDSEAEQALYDGLPAELQAVLFPQTFPDDHVIFGLDGPASAPAAAAQATGEETARGSNNWVVAGSRTATGLPLLANDPHLQLGVPSIWAAVHLRAPGLDVAGVALPGVPGVLIGRTARVAWGCTNVHDDSADLYVITPDAARADHYQCPQGPEPFRVVEERIRVRDGTFSSSWHEVVHPVRFTRQGPVVAIEGRPYALRWTALEPRDEASAFLQLNRAQRLEDLHHALALFPGPSQNFVYADADGHVAWVSAGLLPIRRGGDGSRPYPTSSPDGDWLGYVPYAELPNVVDPPEGVIVTANNRLVGSSYRYRVGRGGIGPWRAAALREVLLARQGWTTDDMVRVQSERLSIPHRDLARALLEAAARHPGDDAWEEVARELRGWDGRLEPDSRAAALVATAFRQIGARVLRPRLAGVAQADRLSRRTAAIQRLVRERPRGLLPAGDADWDATLLACWREGEAEVARTLGADRGRWTWRALNTVTIHHPLARAVPSLARLLDPPALSLGGSATSPNVLYVSREGNVEGPSMRFVANLADPDDTRLTNFMGQSGHVASPHYGDQLEAWARVEARPLVMSPAAVAREARHTLRLVP